VPIVVGGLEELGALAGGLRAMASAYVSFRSNSIEPNVGGQQKRAHQDARCDAPEYAL